jgi:branched-chain amino acid transport system permease protein
VVEFLVMAVVLVVRPWGLMGKPQAAPPQRPPERRCAAGRWRSAAACCWRCWCCCPGSRRFALLWCWPSTCWIAALAASLHFIMGPGGMHSFGHAAYFGLGAYARRCWCARPAADGGALLLAPLAAAAGALLFGWFCVRLSGVYLAMLTLAFAQITWAISSSGMTSPAAATA